MCGRYVTGSDELSWREWWEILSGHPRDPPKALRPDWRPMSQVPVFLRDPDSGDVVCRWMQWGLVPSYAKSPKEGVKMFNLRSETIAKRFKKAFVERRCLLPATSFTHWRKLEDGKQKEPWVTRERGGSLFGLLGIWSRWGVEPLLSCTVLTTAPNTLMRPIHHRMPAIVFKEQAASWLDPQAGLEELENMMLPAESKRLRVTPAS